MARPTDPLYLQQWHFGLIGNIERIWDEYTGRGVHVAVYDDGLQYIHPDLAANYDASFHFRYQNVTYDPTPIADDDAHGTSVAGLIGAVAGNGIGGVGIAPNVTLTGVNYLEDIQNRSLEIATAALRWAANFDVMNNSWGRTPAYAANQSIAVDGSVSTSTLIDAAYKTVVEKGRGGLGTVIVQAAGNDTVNANADGVNASRYTLTIAATEQDGFAASYSNFGVSTLITAPASAVTTDLVGERGKNKTGDADPLPVDYRNSFNGTSAATPTTAGVVALMLEANSGLGWRDVASLLALSASHTGSAYGAAFGGPTERGGWGTLTAAGWNGAGHAYHLSYGFGMLDGYAAVRMAEVWTAMRGRASTSGNEVSTWMSYDGPTLTLPDAGVDWNFNMIPGQASVNFAFTDAIEIETAYVTVDLSHGRGYDLQLWLVTPDGIELPLMQNEDAAVDKTQTGFKWTFGVEALRGLSSAGTWKLLVRDTLIDYSGVLRSAKLEFFGAPASANDIHTYTGNFLALRALQSNRGTLSDSNGGVDWINMAAIPGAVDASLAAGGIVRVAGTQWFRIAAGADTIENIVTGDGNDTVTGNSLNNRILGMRGSDTLSGADGNDTLDGGAGADILRGGRGDDTFIVDHAGDRVFEAANEGTDTVEASVSFSLAGQAIENLVLTGTAVINGTGNSAANTITGNGAANLIDGGTGADQMRGGKGNDTYVVDNSRDRVFEASNEGIDTVRASVSFSLAGQAIENLTLTGTAAINGTGNSGANVLIGNGAANILDGGTGADQLSGLGGNDTYIVDNVRDRVFEAKNGGTDTVRASVSFSLSGQAIENLTLTGTAAINGTGNSGANVLIGNGAANILDGGTGADRMEGLGGNDTYIVDHAGDRVVEAANGGTDTVLSSVTFSLSGQAIENLTLTGSAAINGTGNGSSNVIIGNGAYNRIDGGAGADRMEGRGGNDVYTVDHAGDRVIEAANGGTDIVYASVGFSLAGQEIENLTLTGAAAINGTGNGLANRIIGNSGANRIDGGAGADVLTGGAGADIFLFTSAPGAGNIDRITDFSPVDDTIRLDRSFFPGLSLNVLTAERFKDVGVAGATLDADDRIVYNSKTGQLFFDSNGSDSGGSVQFAVLDNRPALTAADFFVIA
ncbi:S8 family serine peptidase [Ensifer soli]|uniref:S8 family serine peptidase n=1 Tax=Ciceribacter sp. sgz301302 TaxID=3342379 RepID=UPI0035B9D059